MSKRKVMAMTAKLAEYNRKRNFEKTVEPEGNSEQPAERLRFVVQHHLARSPHFDLRLEWDGALLSLQLSSFASAFFFPRMVSLYLPVKDVLGWLKQFIERLKELSGEPQVKPPIKKPAFFRSLLLS
jgi:hypothetical protein